MSVLLTVTKPLVIAHRGASKARAEHTRVAYELALAEGAEGFECDIQLTSDGHIVCIHDSLVDRTSNGSGRVSRMSLAQLKELDFGSWHGDLESRGASVLELDTLLDMVGSNPGIKLFVETKHPVRHGRLVEKKLVSALEGRGWLGIDSPVVFMSFSWWAVRSIHRLAPRLPTVLLRTSGQKCQRLTALWAQATYLGPSCEQLRAAGARGSQSVEGWKASGIGTYCWTVDDPEDVDMCLDCGVDVIASNVPGFVLNRLINTE